MLVRQGYLLLLLCCAFPQGSLAIPVPFRRQLRRREVCGAFDAAMPPIPVAGARKTLRRRRIKVAANLQIPTRHCRVLRCCARPSCIVACYLLVQLVPAPPPSLSATFADVDRCRQHSTRHCIHCSRLRCRRTGLWEVTFVLGDTCTASESLSAG